MTYQEGLAKLESRARFATIILWLFVAVAILTAGGEVLEATGELDTEVDTDALTVAVGLTYVLYSVVFLASIGLVGMWIHRAHANLHDAGSDGLEFTPNWAVGWYFVPIANLFSPFRAMRELWGASHGEHDSFGDHASSTVRAWWGAWIAGIILRGIGTRLLLMDEGGASSKAAANGLSAAGTVSLVIAALLLRKIIAEVTRAQRGGLTAAGVFA